MTQGASDFNYVAKLMDESVIGFCRDLLRLKLHYGIRENREWESLKQYKLLFVPTTEVMAEKDQEALIELAKAGVTLLLCGVMPKYDENFKDCQILAKHFRVKTTVDYRVGLINHKNGAFTGQVYGAIRTSDDGKVKKLCKCDAKVVGVCSSRFKGNMYLFTFDLASGGNHRKLTFIESILEGEKIASYVDCDDPSVDVSFQKGEKKGILFVVVPPPGELSDVVASGTKEIIVQVDLKKAGFSAPRLKLTNILEGEEAVPLKITDKELRVGIPLQVHYPDGLIYLVEKR